MLMLIKEELRLRIILLVSPHIRKKWENGFSRANLVGLQKYQKLDMVGTKGFVSSVFY